MSDAARRLGSGGIEWCRTEGHALRSVPGVRSGRLPPHLPQGHFPVAFTTANPADRAVRTHA